MDCLEHVLCGRHDQGCVPSVVALMDKASISFEQGHESRKVGTLANGYVQSGITVNFLSLLQIHVYAFQKSVKDVRMLQGQHEGCPATSVGQVDKILPNFIRNPIVFQVCTYLVYHMQIPTATSFVQCRFTSIVSDCW